MTHSTTHFDRVAADWDSEPRRVVLMRSIAEKIVRVVPLDREMDLLDYGCGTGLLGLFLLPYVGTVTGADNSPGMLAELQRKIAAGGVESIRAIQLDLERDPVPCARYHLIVSGMALHHIADTDTVLRAFHTLLHPGGMLCLADLDTEPGIFHPAEMDSVVHHHGFDRAEIKRKLLSSGFSELTDATAIRFFKPVAGRQDYEFSVFLITGRI